MSKKGPDRIRYQREHYACFDPNCKAAHDAEYVRLDLHEAALTTVRQEAREEVFMTIGAEMRRYGANIHKVDLLARFQEIYGEAAADSTQKDNEHHG